MRFNIFNINTIAVVCIAAVALLAGCESSDAPGNYWQSSSDAPSTSASTSSSSTTSSSTASHSDGAGGSTGSVSGGADEAPFSAFRWSYGGVNGSGAARSEPCIANLRISGGSMSYSWAGPTLSAWGLSKSDAGAICCLFVQNSAGAWVGGKFDWISTSRTSRSLSHITGGYAGWSLAGVPNPCEAAFVIISANGKRRSNVIKGTWRR